MNKTVGLLAVFAFSFALHAFGEEVVENNPWAWTPADAQTDNASFPAYADGKYDGTFLLNSGTLVFDDLSEKFPKEGFSVNVSGEVELDAWDRRKIVFKYHSNSGDYEKHTEYSNSCFTESITDFITKKNPIAPDGASLSGKIVFASGFFFVPENEVGEWLFEGIYDDNVLLKIDGVQLFKTGSYIDRKQGSTDLGYGWHRFEIRARDGSGDWGAADFLKAQSPGSNGLQPFYEGNFQMGRRVANKASRYVLKSLSLEDAAKVVINNEAVVGSELRLGESCEVYVAENSSLDLRSTKVVGKIRKTGAGAIVFGEDLPKEIVIDSGTLVLMIDHSYDMNKVTLGNGVAVRGLTADGKVIAVGGALGADGKTTYSPLPKFTYTGSEDIPADGFGSLSVSGENTVLTIDSSESSVLLTEVTVQSGATLKVDSHVTIDRLVLEGSGALVVGEGGNVKLSTCSEETVDGQAAVISVLSGGALKTTGPVAVSSVCLKGDASFEIESCTVKIEDFVFEESSDEIPVLAIAESGCLIVPGGSKFGSVAMTVKGQLKAKGQGGIVLGYASAGETRKFDLLVEGGEIETEDGNIDFACPEFNGVVKTAQNKPWRIINAKLNPKRVTMVNDRTPRDYKCGFNFGVNNNLEEIISIDFYGTTLHYSLEGYYFYSGGVVVSFNEGSSLKKDNDTQDFVNGCSLSIEKRARLIFNNSELYWSASKPTDASAGVGCGNFYLNPSEEGYVALKLNNSEFFYHRMASNQKAIIEINDSIYTTKYKTYNYKMPFAGYYQASNTFYEKNQLQEVKLDGDLHIRSNYRDIEMSMPSSVPFTGIGGVYIEKPEGFQSFVFKICSAQNTATGSIKAEEGTELIFESGANWPGTVVYNDNVQFDDMPETLPGEITVGALDLQKPLVYRIWENKNDKINFTGEGIIPNGYEVQILLKDGYNPAPGTTFDLGTVPLSFDRSKINCTSDRWSFSLEDIAGEENQKILRMTVNAVSYVFNGGEDGSFSDISDVSAWTSGGGILEKIPVGQDVSIIGTAEVLGEIPAFSSITLTDGAKFVLRKKEGEEKFTEYVLPMIELLGSAELIVEAGVSVVMNGTISTVLKDDEKCPSVKILKDGALYLLGGSRLSGMSLEVNGVLATSSNGDLTLGYASSGYNLPFALTVNGGTISNGFGNIEFACPAKGGVVTALRDEPWIIENASLKPEAYKGGFIFGVNNSEDAPITIKVIGTKVEYFRVDSDFSFGSVFGVGGAVRVVFEEGSSLEKHYHAGGGQKQHSIFNISQRGQLVFEAGSELLWHAGSNGDSVGAGEFNLNPSEDGFKSLVVSGATFFYHRMGSNSKAVLHLKDATYICPKTSWNFLMPFAAHNSPLKHVFLEGNNKYMRKSGPSYHSCSSKVPFVGTGDLTMVDYENTSTCFAVKSSANEATGKIAAEGGCRLYFLGDSNWNGVVVANGKVELASSVSDSSATHDSPVTVNFANLDLQADFPVKVWKDEDGKITGNDVLNVGAYINNGGRLVPTLADEGDFVLGDKIVLGEIGDSSPLPCVAKGWTASRRAIDGDRENDMLVLSKGVGFLMIVR